MPIYWGKRNSATVCIKKRNPVSRFSLRNLVESDPRPKKPAKPIDIGERSPNILSVSGQGHLKNMSEARIDSGVRIGHVHLKVADLERALGFYRGVLGFELIQRFGNSAAFISAGGYHHHIGLNTWESAGGSAPAPGTTGLYHLAIVYPTQAALADALQRLMKAGVPLDGAADHGVSEALYLRDPDGNGVELYWDRPREEWPRDAAGELTMFTRPLDLQKLLA
jgi:catechol 2,3-dioxygenase